MLDYEINSSDMLPARAAGKTDDMPRGCADGILAARKWPTLKDGLGHLLGFKLGLRNHLIIFGLAIAVPVVLYSAFLLHRFTQSERASNERRALSIARSLSADIDREITAIITTLETLGTSGALARKDFATFDGQARHALKSRPWNVVLINSDAQQVVNTRLPLGTPLPVSSVTEPNLPRIALQSKGPYVSNLFVGTVARRPIFSVSVPVEAGGEPHALVMSLEPERLVEILKQEELPPHWVAGVADRKNTIMARSRDLGRTIGKPLSAETLRLSSGQAQGVITTFDANYNRIFLAFNVSKQTGWRVAAWAPLEAVEAPLREAWALFLVSGAALLSLSLLLALGAGRLMAEPIGALMRAGTALGQGKPVDPISSTLREADELSFVLSNAAKELDARMGAQSHLAAIVLSSPNAIVSLSPDGIIRSWNAAATQLFGYEASEVIGQSVRMFYTDQTDAFEDLNGSVRSGQTVHADVKRRHKDGHMVDVSISVSPMHDDAGKLVGISSIVSDISERKARERHIEFLMRELAHRSKNLLAVIQAIAGQTAGHSSDMNTFQSRFSQRLYAMAQSQDLLVARNWEGAPLRDVVRTQLAAFTDESVARVSITGPALYLKPDSVHSMTLVLHELATNAAKYGALSVPQGSVAIAWSLDVLQTGETRFRISWREMNGPAVHPPVSFGFGHIVIEQMVASSLRGKVALQYAREGLYWALDAPATQLIDQSNSGAHRNDRQP